MSQRKPKSSGMCKSPLKYKRLLSLLREPCIMSWKTALLQGGWRGGLWRARVEAGPQEARKGAG